LLEEFSKKVEQQGQSEGQGEIIHQGEAPGGSLHCTVWVSEAKRSI